MALCKRPFCARRREIPRHVPIMLQTCPLRTKAGLRETHHTPKIMQEELPHELLDLVHFFSPASNCPSYPLPFRRLALFGASPPSSLLHLALSYAQGRKTPSAARRSAANPEEHTVQQKNVLLLCTSRNQFFEGLVLENEEYLAVHGGDPAVARILEQNVEMKFLDTVARWSFFCSAVSSGDHRYQDPSEARALNLKRPPDLVIVSGLSLFLAESRNAGAGIEAYASLIASTLAAFPGDTQFVFFDDPSEEYLSLPILPQQHRKKLKQLDKDKKGSPEKTAAASTVPEGRTMELQAAMDYFCDGIGEVQAEGGTEDVLWYRMVIRRGSAELPGLEVPSTWDGLDRRYAVYRGEDEIGYSGRERWSVRFS